MVDELLGVVLEQLVQHIVWRHGEVWFEQTQCMKASEHLLSEECMSDPSEAVLTRRKIELECCHAVMLSLMHRMLHGREQLYGIAIFLLHD